jgi:hypothetical protein
MEIRAVTVTGADDHVDMGELIDVSAEFPSIEWGILVSNSMSGVPRFPSNMWFDALCRAAIEYDLNLSLHICGRWARDICRGKWSIYEWRNREVISKCFKRIQLNHGNPKIGPLFYTGLLENGWLGLQYIFQVYGRDLEMVRQAHAAGVDVACLFDSSGGRGVSPDKWPESYGDYCGYAGGLSPANLAENIRRISEVSSCSSIWVDAETSLRTVDDEFFLMDEVRKFAAAASH